MISPALWLVILPLGSVPLVYLLRRLQAGRILAILVVLILAWLTLRLPTGQAFAFMGRPIGLDHLSQFTITLLFVSTAVLFLALFFSPPFMVRAVHSRIEEDRRIFYPMVLAILAFFVAGSLSSHIGITAIFIEAAAILTVFVIQGERPDSVRAALRFLILMSLATPLFLLAAWQVDLYQLSGGPGMARNLPQITFFIGFGFALWLAVIPFHSWLTTITAEGSPVPAAFVLIAFPAVAFSTLIHLLIELPWLVSSPQLVRAIVIAGVVTAGIGGGLAIAQRSFSDLMGYTALYDLGCMLALLGLGGREALPAVLAALSVRALALTLIAVGIALIRTHLVGDGLPLVRGLAWQNPLALISLMIGGLTLTGAPFTAGFAWRWQLVRSLAAFNAGWSVLLVLAGLGVAIGYLRGLRIALQMDGRNGESIRLPLSISILAGVLILLCIVVGFAPSLLIEPIQRLTLTIAIPIR